MKNQWTNYYTGYVKVKAYGQGPERLINNFTRQGISVWDVYRLGNDALVFHMDVADLTSFGKSFVKVIVRLLFYKEKDYRFSGNES